MMFSSKGDLFLLFVVFCLSSLVLKCKGEYPPPPACSDVECAPYEVIHSEKDYEIRSYKEAYWLSAPAFVSDYASATDQGFKLILSYCLGRNGNSTDVNMTSPILVDVGEPSPGGLGTSYTVSMYVPRKLQNNIPIPYGDDAKTVKLPQHKYSAVRRFVGSITDDNIPTEIAALRETLKGTPYERAASAQNATLAVYNMVLMLSESINEVILGFD